MDPIAEWSAGHVRVSDLVRDLDDGQAERLVPATPAWTVRELLSHMIGLDVDVVAGNEPGEHPDAWTQRQVDDRGGRSITELLAEWDAVAEDLRTWMRDNGGRPMGDVLIHEQDLRGALGVSGAQETDGLAALRERMVGGFAEQLDGLPSVTLRSPDWTWTSAASGTEADVVLEASTFDLTRALMSRRSAAQLRGWTVTGDVEPLLGAFTTLGPLPEDDLSE